MRMSAVSMMILDDGFDSEIAYPAGHIVDTPEVPTTAPTSFGEPHSMDHGSRNRRGPEKGHSVCDGSPA
jgi:hypothetical protein